MEITDNVDWEAIIQFEQEISFDCLEPDCPPPLFNVPPPPPPPWLFEERQCTEVLHHESCDNTIVNFSQVQLEDTFQTLIIIAVCSTVLVIMTVLSVACIWR